jgi:hypothetical protein
VKALAPTPPDPQDSKSTWSTSPRRVENAGARKALAQGRPTGHDGWKTCRNGRRSQGEYRGECATAISPRRRAEP